MANTINFKIGTTLDKTGLNQLKNELAALQKISIDSVKMASPNTKDIGVLVRNLEQIRGTAKVVETALNNAFNPKLNSVNISSFYKELEKSNLTIKDIESSFKKAGSAGSSAFRGLTNSLLTSKLQLKETNTLLDKMKTTMANTVKWGISSSIFNSFTGSIEKAYSYVKNLDSSLNDIRIVSGQNAAQMEAFAQSATKAAQSLGSSTLDYTKASLIYHQQG